MSNTKKNTSKQKKNIPLQESDKWDYLKTFFTTLFIVVMFGIFNIFYMIHNIFNDNVKSRYNVDAAFESYLVDVLIDQNTELAKIYPKNYATNMRLGILYSYKRDYVNAEREFKNSVEKAVAYDYSPSYQLAKLYIKINRLQDAQDIMDKIGERPNKRLINFKGDIYYKLGEAYYNQGYFALSIMKYEKSMSYYQITNKKMLKEAQDSYVNSCIALGDGYVEVGKIDEAIMALEKAYELDPKNISLNYKLGLLYSDNDIEKAYKLLSFVNKENPEIMNYDLYFNLMNRLATQEDENGKPTEAELFRKKALQYQKFVKNNLLYEKDIFFDVMKLDVNTDIAAQEHILNLQFRLQNNSSLDIGNLYVKAVFKDGDKIFQTSTQQLYDETRVFKAGETTPPISISASEPYDKKYNSDKDWKVEVYAYKYPKYRVLIFEKLLKKPNSIL